MAQVLTNAFKAYIASQQSQFQPVVLDEFVFAYVPGLDATADVDPDEVLPPESQIVHRYKIPQENIGFINADAVVYTCLLGTDVGTWEYNAIYLINSELALAAFIDHVPTQTKVQADPLSGVSGDTLVRNVVTQYVDAKLATEVVIPAQTWQLDFTARLSAMDERQRQDAIAEYGHASFFDDGWKVTYTAGATTFSAAAGVGYVGGLKAHSLTAMNAPINASALPAKVYLVTSFQGNSNSAWGVVNELNVAAALDASWTKDGVTYYAAELASISAAGAVTDLRTMNKETEFERKDNAATNAEIDAESTAAKHVKLPQLWRAMKQYVMDKLWLNLAAVICPVGVPLPWPTDTAPDGFAIMKGQAFDTAASPNTAKAYSSGVLPDMRGLAIVGKKDGELILAYEEDAVKSHAHDGEISATNIGAAVTEEGGEHEHFMFLWSQGTTRLTNSNPSNRVAAYGALRSYTDRDDYSMALGTGAVNTGLTSSADPHTHKVNISSHMHELIIAAFGATENTIKNRKFNWIVRLA